MLDADFVTDCPYEPDAILLDEILEVDREASRIVARVPTHERLPLVVHQKVDPVRHPLHVAAGVLVHLTGMLGYAHAYYVLGLRGSDGWIGFGTNIQQARFGRLVAVGPPLRAECAGTRVRRLRENLYAMYAFRFTQEGEVVYESRQAAVWRRHPS